MGGIGRAGFGGRVRGDRLVDPHRVVQAVADRAMGAAPQARTTAEFDTLHRFDDRPRPAVKRIGFDTPTASNPTYSSANNVTFVTISGTSFALSLSADAGTGVGAGTWTVDVTWGVALTAFSSTSVIVSVAPLVDFGDGVGFIVPDIDVDTTQGLTNGHSNRGWWQATGTGSDVQITARGVFAVRNGGTITLAAGIATNNVSNTATVRMVTADCTPRCTGIAVFEPE